MLTVEQCRKALGKESSLSDDEIVKLRDDLANLAKIVIEQYVAKTKPQPKEANPPDPENTSTRTAQVLDDMETQFSTVACTKVHKIRRPD